MARKRMINPEVRTSEKVASWPIEIRYFWILFWGYVDDHGKGKDNARLIKADCFPLDEDVTSEIVEQWMCVLADAGVIIRYEVDGQRYVAVKSWNEHQKPQHPGKDIYPDWNGEKVQVRAENEELMKSSRESHESFTPNISKVKLNKDNVIDAQERHDVSILCQTLSELITANGSKQPTVTKSWLDAARLLLDVDKRELTDAMELLKWSQEHSFWKSNILSMPTFRKQYDKLRLQREGELNDPRQKPVARFGWQDERGNWIEA